MHRKPLTSWLSRTTEALRSWVTNQLDRIRALREFGPVRKRLYTGRHRVLGTETQFAKRTDGVDGIVVQSTSKPRRRSPRAVAVALRSHVAGRRTRSSADAKEPALPMRFRASVPKVEVDLIALTTLVDQIIANTRILRGEDFHHNFIMS